MAKKEPKKNDALNAAMDKAEKKLKKVKPGKLPKTVQDSLPWINCFENGVFQISEGVFSKTFEFDDISFKTKSDEEQLTIYDAYQKFLNVIRPKEDVYFTIINYKNGDDNRLASVLPVEIGDDLDPYRRELAQIITEKASEAKNNIETRKFITVRVEADSVDEAMSEIRSASDNLSAAFAKCTKSSLRDLDLAERLEVLNIIYKGMKDKHFCFEHDKEGNTSINYTEMRKHDLTTKDLVAPQYMKFTGSSFEIDERVGQTLYLEHFANYINSNFLSDLSELNFETVITMHINPIPEDVATNMLKNKSRNVEAEISESDHVSRDLRTAFEEIEDLINDVANRDQKLFYTNILITHFADDADMLKKQTKTIKNVGAKTMCSFSPLLMQQERGFVSSLPIGQDRTFTKQLLTTESLGTIVPFDEVNQFDKGGFYYGVNQVNRTLIIYNRLKGQNFNGLILGSSGSGKSFSAKREMVSAFLMTRSNIYIIDPDEDYVPLAHSLGGEVIKIAPGNGVHINPFDLDIDTQGDEEANPLSMKTDFIYGLLETMIGGNAQLNAQQKSIVDRCVRKIYMPYIQRLQELPPGPDGKRITIDREHCPTMQNLFDALLSEPQQEAQELALIMETYATGALDTFAYKTNVDVDNRLIVYDIKSTGSTLRELALKICTNDIWNNMMENKRHGIWTWFYIDEFHLLLANNSTAAFIQTIWKRCRKWLGVPTGITQDVGDLLKSPFAQGILNNSSFIYMLDQARMNCDILQELLHLTDADVEFITHAEKGHGLLFTGKQTIPFSDKFPKNTKLFDLMSTTMMTAENS